MKVKTKIELLAGLESIATDTMKTLANYHLKKQLSSIDVNVLGHLDIDFVAW